MDKELIEQIMSCLEENWQKENYNDIIGDLFDTRAEEIYSDIAQNKLYREYINKAVEMEEEIKRKFKNSREIMQTIEDTEGARCEREYLSRKLMYIHGIYDGMKLILDGTKRINNTKFLKENYGK